MAPTFKRKVIFKTLLGSAASSATLHILHGRFLPVQTLGLKQHQTLTAAVFKRQLRRRTDAVQWLTAIDVFCLSLSFPWIQQVFGDRGFNSLKILEVDRFPNIPRICCRTFTSSGDHWQRPILVRFSVLHYFCACQVTLCHPLPTQLSQLEMETSKPRWTMSWQLFGVRQDSCFIFFFFGGGWFWRGFGDRKHGYTTNMKNIWNMDFGWKQNESKMVAPASAASANSELHLSPGEVGRCSQSWCNMQDSAEPIPCCSTGWDYERVVFLFLFFFSNGVLGV